MKALVALWQEKRVQKHLAQAKRTYAHRREALIDSLKAHRIEAHGASGLNVWIPLPEESSVVQALFQRGWAVTAGERYRIRTPPGIRITISTLEAGEAPAFTKDLAEVLRPARRRAAGA